MAISTPSSTTPALDGRVRAAAAGRQVPQPGLRSLLEDTEDTTTFVRVVELVTSRGPLASAKAARIVGLADELAGAGLAHAFSITDNVGGYPKVAPEALGVRLLERGQQVIVHLSCKDLNRNALESRAWTLASMGFENVFVVSGDYPAAGYRGRAAPVFDVDSVALLEMLSGMGEAAGESSRRGPSAPAGGGTEAPVLPSTRLFLGAAVSPFKVREDEQMPQYMKLRRKVEAGARFVITQTGFDARKWDELLKYVALKALDVPALASIFVLSPASARLFHRGAVPGITVSDELLALVERQAASPDRGKAFFRELAAKQVAVARGLGFRGAYLSGSLGADDYAAIFGLADSFATGGATGGAAGVDAWRDLARDVRFARPETFYLFEPDPATGLNSSELNQAYLASLAPEARRALRARAPLDYRLNRLVHDLAFAEGSPGFAVGRRLYAGVDGHSTVKRVLHAAEQAAKVPLFACRDCGDCSLPEIAYLCPESQCAKNQRNGPCGGSHDGICEVDRRECIWARAYDRLKAHGEEEKMLDRPTTVRDGTLRGTSSWANRFLDRDHQRSDRSGHQK